jgi:DNA-3-methyladenine glycosylase
VASDLLGRHLVRDLPNGERRVVRLVETEAYVGDHDLASHSSHGHTPRTAPMFEDGGRAYVYLIYGMYWCLNVVTEGHGRGCAVLLRAAEPVSSQLPPMNGPGRLTRALAVDGTLNRADLTQSPLFVATGTPAPTSEISASPRIGVAYAGSWADAPLRFFVRDSLHVSRRPRPGTPPRAQRKRA